MLSDTEPTIMSVTATTAKMTANSVIDNVLSFKVGSSLFYGVVGVGGGAAVVTLCLIGICVLLGCRRQYNREFHEQLTLYI